MVFSKALFSVHYFPQCSLPPQFCHFTISLNQRLYTNDNFFLFLPTYSFDSSITLQHNALEQISTWMTANHLTLNSSKTEFLLTVLKQLPKYRFLTQHQAHTWFNTSSSTSSEFI